MAQVTRPPEYLAEYQSAALQYSAPTKDARIQRVLAQAAALMFSMGGDAVGDRIIHYAIRARSAKANQNELRDAFDLVYLANTEALQDLKEREDNGGA